MGEIPPPLWHQLNEFSARNSKTQEYATLLSNYAEYLNGEANALVAQTHGKGDAEFWAQTDSGKLNVLALLCN